MNKKEHKAACWIKKTKAGNDYYSVKVELDDKTSVWVNLFYNKFKKDAKHPDFVTIQSTENQKKDDERLPF